MRGMLFYPHEENYQTRMPAREMCEKCKFVLTLRGDIYILTLALPGPVAGRV